MNIFFFDNDITQSVSFYPDCYYKIVLEIAQMCSTAKRLDGYCGNNCYNITHINHPMNKWVRYSCDNYFYAIEIGLEIENEMVWRGFQEHKSARVLECATIRREYFRLLKLHPLHYVCQINIKIATISLKVIAATLKGKNMEK